MKLRIVSVLLVTLMTAGAAFISAQEANRDDLSIEDLRTELGNTRNREVDLQIQLEQLNFDLKEENIEAFFAGVGSTRPELLRESRRSQLQVEKDRVAAQLAALASKSAQLETAISDAQTRAYQQSALGTVAVQTDADRTAQVLTFAPLLIGIAALSVVLGVVASHLSARRRGKLQLR